MIANTKTRRRSLAQAIADESAKPVLPPTVYSHFQYEITRERPAPRRARGEDGTTRTSGRKLSTSRRYLTTKSGWIRNLTTDSASGYTNRRDWQAKAMGMGPSFAFATATGNATATTATSLTNSGAAFPTGGQGLAGQIVVASRNSSGTGATVYGVIVSNTATALTVDQWYDPTSASGAAGTTPNATSAYVILPGQNPAAWLAVTSDAVAPAATDTTLASEATTNGFARAVGTYAHVAAATTYTLTKLFTAAGSLTVNKGAVFGACNPTGGGVMPFESAEPSPPPLISGDTLNQVVTVTIN